MSYTAFTDSGAVTPVGLFVEQCGADHDLTSHEGFVILSYRIHNFGEASLVDLHAAQFCDFDVEGNPEGDLGYTVDAMNLAYQSSATPGPFSPYVGVRLLGGERARSLSLIPAVHVWPHGYLPDVEKADFMTGVLQVPEGGAPDDWAAMVSTGPFSLDPGEHVDVHFAVVAGSSRRELMNNAGRAQQWVSWIGTPTAVRPPGAGGTFAARIESVVPNPLNPSAEIRFEVGGEGSLRLEVFDMRGRRVRTLEEGRWSEGSHRVVWDGRDDRGRAVASGVYLIVLEAAGERWSTKAALVR